ncbi:hypothetical protein T31B1_19107 [Salinisphaera sp. T31B1]
MILEKPDQTVWVWEGEADRAGGRVVIRHGNLDGKLQKVVVEQGSFTQDDAELELQHRVAQKWAEGYVEERALADHVNKPVKAPARNGEWPDVHLMPSISFRDASEPSSTAQPLDLERSIASIVTGEFGLDIAPFWGARPRTLSSEMDLSLPMLIYACALAQQDLVTMADEQGNSLDPVAFIDRYWLEDVEPRINTILSDLGLVSMRRALDLASSESEEWFF